MADPLLDILQGPQTQTQTSGPDPLLSIINPTGQSYAPAAQQAAQAPQAAPISGMERFAQGLRDPIEGGAQLLTKMLPSSVVSAGNALNNWLADKTGLVAKLPTGGVDQQVREAEAAYQARRAASGDTGIDAMRLAGNIINPANLAMGSGAASAAGLASRLPMLSGMGGRVLTGGLAGAGSALTSPVTQGDYWTEKAQQAGTGAALGGITPVVASGISRVISPQASTNPQLQMLRSEGVQPTVGQTLGGMFNTAEQKMTSLPVVGDLIANQRAQAQQQFNQAAINRATGPIGVKVEGAGHDAISTAQGALTDAYNNAKNALGNFQVDSTAQTQLQQLKASAQMLPRNERNTFNALWDTYQNQLTPQGHLLADGFKTLDSKLGTEAAKFTGSNDAYQQSLGGAIKQMQQIITDNAKRANPQASALMDAADKGYANLVRVENAAVAAKGSGGIFTPGQLLSGVRMADKSVRDRATAGGNALMQDLATAGQNILGNKVPDSGTAGRLMGPAVGAAFWANPMLTGTGLATGAAAYSPMGQRLLNTLVSSRPQMAQPIAQSFQKYAPLLIPSTTQVGIGLLNQ